MQIVFKVNTAEITWKLGNLIELVTCHIISHQTAMMAAYGLQIEFENSPVSQVFEFVDHSMR